LAIPAATLAFLFLPGVLLSPSGLSAQQQGIPLVRVDSIAVVGNVRLTEVSIIGTLGFSAGSTVTYREIQKGIKALYATGQFQDVAVFAEGAANEPVLLRLEVEERDIVQRITIAGLEHAKEETVRDTAGLQTGQPYSPPKILAAKEFIRSELAKEGIPFARIEERTEDIPDKPGEINLFLDVTEGNRITVAQLAVSGNEVITDSEIRGAMSTKPEGFWWFRSGTYDAEQFRSDLAESIPALYRTKGFLDMQVLSDTLIVDPETGKTRVEVQVEEGPRYRLADFSVEGNRRFSTEELEAYFQTGGGGLLAPLGFGGGGGEDEEYFNATAFEEGMMQVQQAYSNEGYLYARVDPFVEHVETEEGEPPAVRAGWRIVEGNPAYVNRVNIEGNDFTHERVIREKGAKRVMLKNVQEAKFKIVLTPIAQVVLTDEDREHVSFDAFFTHILMHELVHGLGPHDILVGERKTTVRRELKETYSIIEEAKADISGLFAFHFLAERGVLDAELMNSLYQTYLASAFRSIRFGINEAHGRGMAIQLNFLLDFGAIRFNADGTLSVDIEKMQDGVLALTRDIMHLQAEGSYAKAKDLLDRLGVLRPEIQKVLDRLDHIPVDIEPVFTTAEQLLSDAAE